MNTDEAVQGRMAAPAWVQLEERPGLGRRGLAKLIDLVATGFTVVGFAAVTHSQLAGLLIGYGWLTLSDAGGSLGKWVTGLAVRDYRTGADCSAVASALRNAPYVLVSLPHRLHQAVLGLGPEDYREHHEGVLLLMSGLAAVALITLIAGACRSGERRHWGDLLAGTIVTRRRRGKRPSGPEAGSGDQ